MKVNRFQKQEHTQGVQFEEMEASLASFLSEIEDENTKLIETMKKEMALVEAKIQREPVTVMSEPLRQPVVNKETAAGAVAIAEQPKVQQEQEELPVAVTYSAPKAYVQNAYHAQKKDKPVQTTEQKVQELYVLGMSIEEIAKKLSKGRTEIELLLKFNNKNA